MSEIKKRTAFHTTTYTFKKRSSEKPSSRPAGRSVSLKTQMTKHAIRDLQQQKQQTVEGDATEKAEDMTTQAIHRTAAVPQTVHKQIVRRTQAKEQKQARQKQQTQNRTQAQPQPQEQKPIHTEPPKHTSEAPPLRTRTVQSAAAPSRPSNPAKPTMAQRRVAQARKRAQNQQKRIRRQAKAEPEVPANVSETPPLRTRTTQASAAPSKPTMAQRQVMQANQKKRAVQIKRRPETIIRTKAVVEAEQSEVKSKIPTAQTRMRTEGVKAAKKKAQARQRRRFRVTYDMDQMTPTAQEVGQTTDTSAPLKQLSRQPTSSAVVQSIPKAQDTQMAHATEQTAAAAKEHWISSVTADPAKQAVSGITGDTGNRAVSNVLTEAARETPASNIPSVRSSGQAVTNMKSSGVHGRAMQKSSRIRVSASATQPIQVREAARTEIKTASTIKPKINTRTIKRGGKTVVSESAAKRFHIRAQKVSAAKASAAKKTIKAKTVAAIKAVIKAAAKSIKGIISAIAGAGAGVLAPLIVIILLGALLCGPLGLFFTGEADNEMTLQQAMGQLNTEFSDRITEIENSVPHDDVRQEGHRAIWKDILTVYAVKATTDESISMDVITMDDDHITVLQEIFWDMNAIDYTTENYTEYVSVEVEVEDEEGETHTETQIQAVTRTRLVILITGKTAVDMAAEYNFNQEQINLVTELLSDDYTEFWSMKSVPGVGSGDIVEVALSQLGNVGGYPYWSWYGFSYRVSWCACFVSWCADQCGYIEAGIIPSHSLVDDGIYWFQRRGQWQDRYYLPSPGDIIYFDWQPNGYADHVGIVEYCDGFYVHTVEGNSGDACRQQVYAVGSNCIFGYGVPAY